MTRCYIDYRLRIATVVFGSLSAVVAGQPMKTDGSRLRRWFSARRGMVVGMIDAKSFKEFFSAWVVEDVYHRTPREDVWQEWLLWCAERDMKSSTKRQFSKAMKSEGIWSVVENINKGDESETQFSWACRLERKSGV